MNCEHKYARVRRWPVKLRWRCIHCGDVSRLYDAVDRMSQRPVHPHMCVVVKGFNTVTTSADDAWLEEGVSA